MPCRTVPAPNPTAVAQSVILRHLAYLVAHFIYPFERFRRLRSRWNSWEPVKCKCGWVGMRGPNVNHDYDYCSLLEEV